MVKSAERVKRARTGLRVVRGTAVGEIVEELREGLPYSRAVDFARESGLTLEQIFGVMQIPRRTLARRRQAGRFSVEESERLERLARLYARAVELFGEQSAAVANWMSRPCKGLGDVSPLVMAETEIGAREVESVIGRLEDGVFM